MKRGPWRVEWDGHAAWDVIELDPAALDAERVYCTTGSVEDAHEIARNLNETVWGEAYPEVPE